MPFQSISDIAGNYPIACKVFLRLELLQKVDYFQNYLPFIPIKILYEIQAKIP